MQHYSSRLQNSAPKMKGIAQKRIIFLFNSFVSVSGGDVRFIEIFKRIKNFDKVIITPFIGRKICEKEKLDATYILTTKETRFKNIFFTYFARIVKALLLKTEIRGEDVLYSTSDFLPDVLPAFFYKWKNKNIRWVQIIHHIILLRRQGSFITNTISFCAQRISFFLISQKSDLIITVSPWVKEQLRQIGFDDSKIKVNSNGINVNYFENLRAEEKVGYDGVFLGRLHPSKGIFDLVRIWKVVCEHKSVRLGIIGNGDERTKQALIKRALSQGLSHNIDILGYLDADQAFGIIKSSKVFVFPSHEEGFGIAILEAMACGLPVVAWNLPVYRKVFSQGMIVVSNGNIKEIAENVLKLLEDSGLRDRVGKEASEFASKYSWDGVARQEMLLIEGL